MAVERLNVIEEGSPWREEHLARYYFAKKHIVNKSVLDIACGTGYGSLFMLNNGCANVTAVDISDEAIASTKLMLAEYIDKSNVLKADGTNLPFKDDAFDVVVSFETIEHIKDYTKFLSELYRVLKPNGQLIISTPNSLITKPKNGVPQNPFHVIEFTPDEMKVLLKNSNFNVEESLGQHVDANYGVVPFLPSFNREKLSAKDKINFSYWRLLLRMPIALSNFIHGVFFSKKFYPEIEDYTFLSANLNSAHVQYHICRKF